MTKTSKARHTLEFKQEAVRLADNGQSIAAVARTPGVVDQALFNWVKAQSQKSLSSKPLSAEQMEISRLRAELALAKMERDILGVLRKRIDLKYPFKAFDLYRIQAGQIAENWHLEYNPGLVQ